VIVGAVGGGGFLFLIVAVFALMWLFVIRPQKRRQLQQQRLLEDVAPGDEILTAGGLYGTVRAVDGDEVTLEVAPGTNVRLAKRAVAAILTPDDTPAEPEEEIDEPDEEPEELTGAGGPIEQKHR
jgi:preprotein translocase subunit YajC